MASFESGKTGEPVIDLSAVAVHLFQQTIESELLDEHDEQGDAVIVTVNGPRQVTDRGYIQPRKVAAQGVTDQVNRQGGMGLPSFNPRQDLPEITELAGGDDRVSSALGLPRNPGV